MKFKAFAALTAAALSLTAMPLTAFAEGEAPGSPIMPTTFEEAVEFRNLHGNTYIDNYLVYVVFREYVNTDTAYSISAKQYSMDPDMDGMALAHEVYHEVLTAENSPYQYEVAAYAPDRNSGLSVELSCTDGTVMRSGAAYTFETDAEGNITQTDIFGWLSDCITEYDAFIEENGAASVHEDYIVYCTPINYSTGADLTMEQNGTAEIEAYLTSTCTNVGMMENPPGSSEYYAIAYKAKTDGTTDVTWKVGRAWDPEGVADSLTEKSYEISENGTVIQDVTGQEPSPAPLSVAGDINGDGALNVLDLVTLQKWVLGEELELADWEAADLCKDDVLDVFDLSMMKYCLTLNAEPEDPRDEPQTPETLSETKLLSVEELRQDANDHTEWKGYVVRDAGEFYKLMDQDGLEESAASAPLDPATFDECAFIFLYSKGGAGNCYSIVDSMTVQEGKLLVKTTTKRPMIATPDMLYRRYIFAVNKEDVASVNGFSFTDSASDYAYEEEADVYSWFATWRQEQGIVPEI